MNIHRRCNTFERVFSLTASLSAPASVQEKVLQLAYRAIYAGGSTTLVTNCGITSWLSMRRADEAIDLKTFKVLVDSLDEQMDQSKAMEWSGGAYRMILKSIPSTL